MSFIKKLVQPRSHNYDNESFIADTDQLTNQIPQLTTFNTHFEFDKSFLNEATDETPESITLRFKLLPIRLTPKKITGQLFIRGEHWQTTDFYEQDSIKYEDKVLFPQCQWQGIDFIYQGTGTFIKIDNLETINGDTAAGFKLNCTVNECFYKYQFVLPEQNQYVLEQVPYVNNNLFTLLQPYVSGMNVQGFIPYSGFIPNTLDVKNICQAYAVIADRGKRQTMLRLYTQGMLNDKAMALSTSTFPTLYQLAANPHHLSKITLTLAGFITQGHIKLTVKSHDDRIHDYQSRQYIQTDINTGEIDITFLKKDSTA